MRYLLILSLCFCAACGTSYKSPTQIPTISNEYYPLVGGFINQPIFIQDSVRWSAYDRINKSAIKIDSLTNVYLNDK